MILRNWGSNGENIAFLAPVESVTLIKYTVSSTEIQNYKSLYYQIRYVDAYW